MISCEQEPPIERSDAEEKLAEQAKAQKKQRNKGKKRHEKCAKEANQAHTQMHSKAMRIMDKINSLLHKFETKDSD